MRLSGYNAFFKHKGCYIGYNTLYDTLIVITEKAFPYFQKGMRHLPSFAETCQYTYRLLLENHFIIEDSFDEIEYAKGTFYKTNHTNQNFRVIINPTLNCNFHCWYCYENHSRPTRMTMETRRRIVAFIKNLIDSHPELEEIQLDWFGGEPLLLFDECVAPITHEICDYAKMKMIRFISSFTTNGFLLSDKVIHFCMDHSAKQFQITLDGHKERHNQIRYRTPGDNTYDCIIEHIKNAIAQGAMITLRINISKDTHADILEILSDFRNLSDSERKRLLFSIHKIWQEEDTLDAEIDQILHHIREKGFRGRYYATSPYSIRHTCYADKENEMVINYDGSIYKCTARDFNSNHRKGFINSKGLIERDKDIVVTQPHLIFDNPNCRSCILMPMCNNGCYKKREEKANYNCSIQSLDTKKMDFVKRVALERIFHSEKFRHLI